MLLTGKAAHLTPSQTPLPNQWCFTRKLLAPFFLQPGGRELSELLPVSPAFCGLGESSALSDRFGVELSPCDGCYERRKCSETWRSWEPLSPRWDDKGLQLCSLLCQEIVQCITWERSLRSEKHTPRAGRARQPSHNMTPPSVPDITPSFKKALCPFGHLMALIQSPAGWRRRLRAAKRSHSGVGEGLFLG